MQIQIHPVNTVSVKGEVSLTADEVKPFLDKALADVEKHVRIDGFRKGHAPKSVVLQYYGSKIGIDASEAIINSQYMSVLKELKEQGIVTAPTSSRPTGVNFDEFVTYGKDWSYTVDIETFPRLEKIDLSDVEVELVEAGIDDESVNFALESLRMNDGVRKNYDDLAIAKGEHQFANIDFVGKNQDGTEFQGGSAKGFDLDIDNGRMIPGFIEGLYGHKAGDKFTLNVTFPADYHVEELRSAPATFDITINSVAKLEPAELNDDFCRKYGFDPSKGKTLEDLKYHLYQNLLNQCRDLQTNYNTDEIVQAIVKKYGNVEVPPLYLEYQAASSACRYLNLKEVPSRDNKIAPIFEHFVNYFKHSLKPSVLRNCLVLVLAELYGFNLTSTDEERNAELEHLFYAFEQEDGVDLEAFKKKASSDSELKELCSSNLFSAKLLEGLKSLVKVKVKNVTFAELVEITRKKQEENEARVQKELEQDRKAAAESKSESESSSESAAN